MPKIRLFCIPYAGGSGIVYQAWKRHIPDFVEVFPVELAGRGSRRDESPYQTFDDAVVDVYKTIAPLLDEMPYALFGHSMGSWLAYELDYLISQSKNQKPVHLFLSGRRAPNLRHTSPLLHNLPESELEEALVELGGVPREFFRDEQMKELFLGVIRADLRITESYEFRDRGYSVQTPVTVLGGKKDHTTQVKELLAWRNLITGSCSICTVDGGHFFITQNMPDVLKIVTQALERLSQSKD